LETVGSDDLLGLLPVGSAHRLDRPITALRRTRARISGVAVVPKPRLRLGARSVAYPIVCPPRRTAWQIRFMVFTSNWRPGHNHGSRQHGHRLQISIQPFSRHDPVPGNLMAVRRRDVMYLLTRLMKRKFSLILC